MTAIRDYPVPNAAYQSRFWSKVDMTGGPVACWPWKAGKLERGYGNFWMHGKPSWRAHRVAFVIKNGPLSSEKEVCHRCDNTSCCNPAHLFAGSHTDNIVDMFKKGRGNSAVGSANGSIKFPELLMRGEDNSSHKLTELQVIEIRKRIANGTGTYKGLGREFGVHKCTIKRAVTHKTWRHVA